MKIVLTIGDENGDERQVELVCERTADTRDALRDALNAAARDTAGKPGDGDGWRISGWRVTE